MGGEDQKTEEPSGKRLGEAQEKGQVPESQEVGHWFMLFASTMVVMVFGGEIARRMFNGLTPFLEAPHLIATDPNALTRILGHLGSEIGLLLLAPVLILVVAA